MLSIIFSYLFLPVKCGDNPSIKITKYPILYNSMIIIPINSEKALHIHHWLIYSIIILLSGLFFKIPDIITSFSLGLVFQGLLYDDCFDFLCENPY